MSRAKFEEWAKSLGWTIQWTDPVANWLYEAWLAGRESMRHEAEIRARESQSGDGRAQARYVTAGKIAEEIGNIEL